MKFVKEQKTSQNIILKEQFYCSYFAYFLKSVKKQFQLFDGHHLSRHVGLSSHQKIRPGKCFLKNGNKERLVEFLRTLRNNFKERPQNPEKVRLVAF